MSNLERELADLHRRSERRQTGPTTGLVPPGDIAIEALVLKVLGGWEVLKSDVSWAYFHAAGPGGPPATKPDKVAPTIRQAAEWLNVRWPHDQWAATCDQAGKVRHKLAHLLYVTKVDNESPSPNRKLAFMRLGAPGEPRKVDKRPGELNFRDDVWSAQKSHLDAVTEKELADALQAIRWLVDCVFFLSASEACSTTTSALGPTTTWCRRGSASCCGGGCRSGVTPKQLS